MSNVDSKMPSDAEIMDEAIRLVESGVSVTFPVNGRSMLPFVVGGRDSLVLEKPQKIKMGDAVLAFVDGCRYVIHRVVRMDGEKLTLMGDGNLVGTEHCEIGDVKAIATYVVKPNKKRVSLGDSCHRRAAKLWMKALPVRRYLLKVYRILFRI